jgi:hypothetical protein
MLFGKTIALRTKIISDHISIIRGKYYIINELAFQRMNNTKKNITTYNRVFRFLKSPNMLPKKINGKYSLGA